MEEWELFPDDQYDIGWEIMRKARTEYLQRCFSVEYENVPDD